MVMEKSVAYCPIEFAPGEYLSDADAAALAVGLDKDWKPDCASVFICLIDVFFGTYSIAPILRVERITFDDGISQQP
jgi:hypothetical protein